MERTTLENRHQDLKREFEAGQKLLRELETKQHEVRDTLLRIGGAIQVLEELLTGTSAAARSDFPTGSRPE